MNMPRTSSLLAIPVYVFTGCPDIYYVAHEGDISLDSIQILEPEDLRSEFAKDLQSALTGYLDNQ